MNNNFSNYYTWNTTSWDSTTTECSMSNSSRPKQDFKDEEAKFQHIKKAIENILAAPEMENSSSIKEKITYLFKFVIENSKYDKSIYGERLRQSTPNSTQELEFRELSRYFF